MHELTVPFEAATKAALSFENPLAQSTLLGEVARSLARQGHWDKAFENIAQIPNRAEKRSTLRDLALENIRANTLNQLPCLVKTMLEADPTSGPVVGRLAMSLLENEHRLIAPATMIHGVVCPRADVPPGVERIQLALELLQLPSEPFDSLKLFCLFVENVNEAFADDFALLFGVGYARQVAVEFRFGINADDMQTKMLIVFQHVFKFIFAQQSVVNENTGQVSADGFIQ